MKIRGVIAALAIFGIIGVALILWGWTDYQESHTASFEPVAVELADLEAGKKLDNNHVRIGDHAACYYAAIYAYKKSRFSFSKPDENTSVNECYYPIVDPANPAVQKIKELEKTYGSLDKVPESVEIKPPEKFVVVVKTHRFKKVKDIPNVGVQSEQQVQGLILNRTRPLGTKEMKLLKEEFPKANFDQVMVLEEGRGPSSTAWCFTRIGLGLLSILVGIGIAGLGILRMSRSA